MSVDLREPEKQTRPLTLLESRLVDGVLTCESIAVEYLELLADIFHNREVCAVMPPALYKRLFKAVTDEDLEIPEEGQELMRQQAQAMIEAASDVDPIHCDLART